MARAARVATPVAELSDTSVERAHAEIARQHQRLFRLIRQFLTAWRNGSDPAGLALRLEQIRAVTRRHFAAEEIVLQNAAPRQAPAHAEIHARISAGLRDRCRSLSIGEAETRSDDLVPTLFSDLLIHLIREDETFAAGRTRPPRATVH